MPFGCQGRDTFEPGGEYLQNASLTGANLQVFSSRHSKHWLSL